MTCGECDGENTFFLTKSTCLARRAWAALQSEQDALKQMFGCVYDWIIGILFPPEELTLGKVL